VQLGGKQPRMLHTKRIDDLTKRREVRTAVDLAVTKRLVVARTDTERTAVAVERRVAAILASVDNHRPTLLQGSLFDRRAEQQRQSREATIRLWRDHLARRAGGAEALRQLRAAEPQLVAAWFV
jgi:isocitrate lyase